MKTFSQQMETALQGTPSAKLPARPETNPAPAADSVFPPGMAEALHGNTPAEKSGTGPQGPIACIVID
jgi:hypothetical protein